jgi:CRP-like cAMP-binding protein
VADPRVARLKTVPLFFGCTDRELEFIASRVDEVDLPAGKVLTKQGESGGEFFILIDGRVDVDSPQGRRSLGPGEFFGEIALLDNGPRTATVKTTTPVRCLVLGPSQFQDVLYQNASIAVKMLHAVTDRLRAYGPLPTG